MFRIQSSLTVNNIILNGPERDNKCITKNLNVFRGVLLFVGFFFKLVYEARRTGQTFNPFCRYFPKKVPMFAIIFRH